MKSIFIPNTYKDPSEPLTCERGQVGLCQGLCSYLFQPDREKRLAHPEWGDVLLDSIRCVDVQLVKTCLEAGACSRQDQQVLIEAFGLNDKKGVV